MAELLLRESPGSKLALEVGINFKVCVDCHEFFKEASKMLQRRIICDDGSHHHVFDDGECSCGDRWR